MRKLIKEAIDDTVTLKLTILLKKYVYEMMNCSYYKSQIETNGSGIITVEYRNVRLSPPPDLKNWFWYTPGGYLTLYLDHIHSECLSIFPKTLNDTKRYEGDLTSYNYAREYFPSKLKKLFPHFSIKEAKVFMYYIDNEDETSITIDIK